MRPPRAALIALSVVLLAPVGAGAQVGFYDGGHLYAGYSYGPGPGYPLSLPQTLRGTVRVPLPEPPAGPADTLAALYPALAACWSAPPALDGREVEITAQLSLRRDGSLIGPPRITYAAGIARDERPALVAATLDALAHCTPAHITAGLGRAIAGRPVALRFVHRPPA